MKHLIFDTETTGLVSNSAVKLDLQPRIIEFAGILIDGKGKLLDELEFMVNPGIEIPEIITKITGITNNDVFSKPSFSENAAGVKKIISAADVYVAHNLSYDYALVNSEFMRLNQSITWRGRGVCTVEATEHIKGFRLSLTALHEHLFGEAFNDAHRARKDVDALARCYVELLKREVI